MDIIYRYDPYKAIAGRGHEDSTGAINALERGHDRYVRIVTEVQKELVGDHSTHQVIIPSDPLTLGFPMESGAAPVQSPFALVLGCSDARVPIEQIFDQSPNDLFVIRVAGNVLGVECLGSIDYAVNQFAGGLKLLVVLGHSTCGAVSAAVDSYLVPKDYSSIAFTHALRSLVRPDPGRRARRGHGPRASPGDLGLPPPVLSYGADRDRGLPQRGDHGIRRPPGARSAHDRRHAGRLRRIRPRRAASPRPAGTRRGQHSRADPDLLRRPSEPRGFQRGRHRPGAGRRHPTAPGRRHRAGLDVSDPDGHASRRGWLSDGAMVDPTGARNPDSRRFPIAFGSTGR